MVNINMGNLAICRAPEAELDGPICQLHELVDMLLKGLIREEVVPLAPLKHDSNVSVAVLKAVAVPTAFCVIHVGVKLQSSLVPKSRVRGHGADLVLEQLVCCDPLVVVPSAKDSPVLPPFLVRTTHLILRCM